MTDLPTELRDIKCVKDEAMCNNCKLRLKAADEIERLRAELENSEGMLASLCDRMNTWARELGTEESTRWKDLGQMQQLLDRVVFAAKGKNP